MSQRPTYMITTAIPYANGAPHIGHAYERIATDAFARWKRLDGYDVLFVTGMDEHGQKMQRTAEREGLTPAAARRPHRRAVRAHGRGAERPRRRHHAHDAGAPQGGGARNLAAHGGRTATSISSKYAGWYSVRDEAYYDEGELTEREGKKFAPTGTPVEWVEEESWFFRLSAYAREAARAL